MPDSKAPTGTGSRVKLRSSSDGAHWQSSAWQSQLERDAVGVWQQQHEAAGAGWTHIVQPSIRATSPSHRFMRDH